MIVLDTHAWIWWISDPAQLSARAQDCIGDEIEAGQVYVSSISAWELALLVNRGRLSLTMDVETWLEKSEALPPLFESQEQRTAFEEQCERATQALDSARQQFFAEALQHCRRRLADYLLAAARRASERAHDRTSGCRCRGGGR